MAASSVGETTNSGRRVRHNNLTPLQQPLVAQAPNWNRSPKIIQRESSESTKFELFQHLNTGVSALSDQEVRNAILVMLNPDVYRWIHNLSQETDFQTCLPILDRDKQLQYDLELATRFIVLRRLPEEGLRSVKDIGEFLTDNIVKFAQSGFCSKVMETETATVCRRARHRNWRRRHRAEGRGRGRHRDAPCLRPPCHATIPGSRASAGSQSPQPHLEDGST